MQFQILWQVKADIKSSFRLDCRLDVDWWADIVVLKVIAFSKLSRNAGKNPNWQFTSLSVLKSRTRFCKFRGLNSNLKVPQDDTDIVFNVRSQTGVPILSTVASIITEATNCTLTTFWRSWIQLTCWYSAFLGCFCACWSQSPTLFDVSNVLHNPRIWKCVKIVPKWNDSSFCMRVIRCDREFSNVYVVYNDLWWGFSSNAGRDL